MRTCAQATPNATADDPELAALLAAMKACSARPLASYDPSWHFELGAMVKQAPAPLGESNGMVRVPGGKYRFVVQGVMIEGGGSAYDDIGAHPPSMRTPPQCVLGHRCAYSAHVSPVLGHRCA